MKSRTTPGVLEIAARSLIASAIAWSITCSAWAQAVSNQNASAAVDPQMLAKYDKDKNGRLDESELAVMRTEESARSADPETVVLSPFQVEASANDVGYYAANTLSGTRLNTKIEDLGSSITVVTKQQMADFAMLDVNDIFNYEVSTEGTGNYTQFEVDRNGMVTDQIQNNPQGANRIRGGGAANIALDNFGMSGRVPVDPINIESVEISRGPNSSIFGLGEGSGTVNLISATANLRRSSTSWDMRIDDIGGYRTSLDVSRPIIEGTLALRASAVYQQDEFRQKPAGFTTRRFNVMLNAQPWKNTSIRASFQSYHASGTRASTITPRDTVTYWRSLGSPTWDPVANAVTVNGVTTVMSGTTNPTGLANSSFQALPSLFIDQNGIGLWMVNRLPAATVTAVNAPNTTNGVTRFLDTVPDPVRTGRPLWTTVRGISDKSIYNWEDINLAAINNLQDQVETTTIQIEQTFLQSERHQLALQLGWNREDADRMNRNVVGQSSATGNSNYLYVDVNSRLLNGQPNPYFLRPYLGVGYPATSNEPNVQDNYRGTVAYQLDFSRDDNWRQWLGRHRVVGYAEYRNTERTRHRYRDVMISDHPYNEAGRPKANQSGVASRNSARGYWHYYVGDNVGQNIDYGPQGFEYGQYPFNWYNTESGQWVTDQVTLGRSAVVEGSNGTFGSRNVVKTEGFMVQSFLFKDRIVLTAGWRKDETNNKYAAPAVLMPNGYDFDYAAMHGFVGDWLMREGSTKTKGIVVKPLRWLNLHYNESDSFRPESPAINIQGDALPNPSSNGKDYGFSLNFGDGRFVLRANRYENNNINSRGGQSATFANRALRMDFFNFAGNADNQSLQRQARLWVAAANPTWTTDQVDTEVLKIMQISPELEQRFLNNTISDTEDTKSEGEEYEFNWNPDSMFTVKLNIARQESINGSITPGIVAWVTEREKVWTTIIDPRSNTNWYTQRYDGSGPVETGGGIPKSFIDGNVWAPINLGRATEGKSRPQIREWRANLSTSLSLAKFSQNSVLKNVKVGGSLRWEDKGAIGYYSKPTSTGDIYSSTEFDGDRPIYDKAHTYVDLFFTYNTRAWDDRVRVRYQLNIRNVQDSGGELRPVGAFPDGEAHTFRIIDPRVFIFTASFSM